MCVSWVGLIGFHKITESITAIRLAEVWDDFNEARIAKQTTAANIIMQGVVSDHRVSGYIGLILGVVNIAFFGICVLQASIVLGIFQPPTDKNLVDTIAWTGALFIGTFFYRLRLLWCVLDSKKKIGDMKRRLTVFPREKVNDLLDIFHDTEFYAGTHEGLLILCPEYKPAIYPERQISLELKNIDDELDRLCSMSKVEIRSLCETAIEKCDIEASRYSIEALIHFVIAFCAVIGYPFNYYHAAASYRWFGDFSSKLVYFSEVVRNSTLVLDAVVSYFVLEPAVDAVQTYRQKKAKML